MKNMMISLICLLYFIQHNGSLECHIIFHNCIAISIICQNIWGGSYKYPKPSMFCRIFHSKPFQLLGVAPWLWNPPLVLEVPPLGLDGSGA
jgi:hypothetical protein